MRTRANRRALSCVVTFGCAALLVACEGTTAPGNCTDIAKPALLVRVQDSLSGAGLAAGATLVLQEGAFIDSVALPAGRADLADVSLTTDGTFERAGTYAVTVRRAGYADWVRTGVEVSEGRCHVSTVSLTARLRAAAAD